MQKLLIGAAALALITGCNQSSDSPTISDEPLKELEIRAGNPANAESALAAMSLADSGAGVLSFSGKTVDGATATFTDLSIAGAEEMTIGSLVFEGLDTTDAGADFGKMSLNDIKVDAPDGTGGANLGSLEVVNPSPALAAWIAGVLDDGEPDADFPEVGELSFGSISFNDLSGNFSDPDAEGTFGLGKIEIRDMADLKAGRATLSDLALDMVADGEMPVNIKLDSMSMSGIDGKLLEVVQDNMDAGEEELLAAIMSKAYENPMDPGYDGFSMGGLSAAVAGATFAMPSLESFIERNDAGQPVKYVTKPYTMTLKADPEAGEVGAQLLEGLSMIGYESLELKGESVANYDPDADMVSFDAKNSYFELVDGAKFSFGGKLEGYSAFSQGIGQSMDPETMFEGAEPDLDAMMAAYGALTVHGFEFSIDDDSLVDRIINASATQAGQDPQQMKNQIAMGLGMAPMMASGSGVDMELVTEAAGALSSFISDPGKLTIKLDPSEPISFAALMENPDPSALTKEFLGFSAEAK